MNIAIIGGVAAGTSAAAKASRENKDAEIVLFERDTDISYAGCGLPYYISEVTSGRDKVIINKPQEFAEKYGVQVRTKHEVFAINPADKELEYRDLNTDEKGKYQYDKLIITTGASPIQPPIPGSDLEGVVTLRTVNDADRVKELAEKETTGKVVIIGAGLIGLEMAESFSEKDLDVSVVEMQSQILPLIEDDMAEIVEDHIIDKGVDVFLDDPVKSFEGENKVKRVVTESGNEIDADLVLLSIGIKPNVELARDAGVIIGETGAISVNEKMETSLPDIYAAGDCAESKELITGSPVWVPLGSTANKQGRIAGENAAGGDNFHRGVLKTGITKIFDLTVATTGLRAEEATRKGFAVETVKITGVDHAGYYPGLNKLYLKGVFDKDSGRILGATVIGKNGADKRIDVLSTAIYSKLTANDLFQLDLAYAPPYSTPKDAAEVLGMVADKKLNKN